MQRSDKKSVADFQRPQALEWNQMHFFAGSAGEKILLSPQVCGPNGAVRAGGCYPPIFEARRVQKFFKELYCGFI